MEKFSLAVSRFRRYKFDECILLCDEILKTHPNDYAVQLLKTHAIRKKQYIDDIDYDEEAISGMLLDEHAISSVARPGTSIQRVGTSAGKGSNPMIRPSSSAGRPMSGVVRPATGRTATASNEKRLSTANKMNRAGTGRAMTSGGRQIRLATASLQSLNSSPSLNINDINPKNVVKKKSLAKAVVDYIFYVERNYKKLLEICSEGTQISNYSSWWWKYKLGKVYYKIGMMSEAEKQLLSSLKHFNYVNCVLQLSNVYIKIDQPIKALDLLSKAINENPGETHYIIHQARIEELINEYDRSVSLYKSCLLYDNCNFEAIACIGSHHFYSDQPEIALKFYKRLLELGLNSAELWNNIGLCAYFSGQYDICLSCFERGLLVADDNSAAEIWYNISHVAIGLGDLSLAYQALKIAISFNADHFEAFNNIGILEIKKGNFDQAKSNFLISCKNTDYSFEPYYNYANLRYKQGELEESVKFAKKAIEIFPQHFESKELVAKIQKEIN